MAGMMTAQATAAAPRVMVENRGVGGHSSVNGLGRFQRDVEATPPQHLILYFGINDALNSGKLVSVETFRANLQQMIDRARACGVRTIVLTTPNPIVPEYLAERHPKHPQKADLNAHLATFDQAVRDLAKKNKLPFVDLARALAPFGSVDGKKSLLRNAANSRSRDGVHLTAEGYRVMAGLYASVLKPLVKPGDRVVCLGDSITYGAAMKGAGTTHGQTYPAWLSHFLNSADGLRIKNGSLELAFRSPEQGGGLLSAVGANGHEFLNGGGDGSLWRIHLRRIPEIDPNAAPTTAKLSLDPERADGGTRMDDGSEGDDLIVLSAAEAQAQCSVSRGADSLTLVWKGMDVGGAKGVLDVSVTVRLKPGDEFARFRAGFSNRSKTHTVLYLVAPLVQGVGPTDGDFEADRLAIPCYTGRLIRNPIRKGLLGKDRRFQPNRSGHSMQFDAYYHKGDGLYLGCFDSEQYVKRYLLETDRKQSLSWAVVHVPDNVRRVPQEWEVPYDTVLRTFRGDWYDAAKIYRRWALGQSWTKQGPLLSRADTPQWFKEIDEWLLWGFHKSGRERLYADKVQALYKGLNVGMHAGGWGKNGQSQSETPDHFPLRDTDKAFLQDAKSHNYAIMGYIQGVCWDVESPSFKALNGVDHTVRTFEGKRLVWDFSASKLHACVCAIASPGPVWEKALGDTVEKMAKAGFRAAYLDSNNHAGTYLNFNPNYGEERGGGRAYIANNRRMVRAIKERARKIDPEFCFTAESFWEGNMAELDAFVACNTTNQYLEGARVSAIPLAQSVYHDYTILYSAWVGKPDLEQPGARGYIAKFGQAFLWGVKAGWNQPTLVNEYKNYEIAYEATRRRYAAGRVAGPYLTYGTMMRPPVLSGENPPVAFTWYRGWSSRGYDITQPAVQATWWKSPDRAFALVLYNIDDAAHTVEARVELPVKYYATTPKTLYAPEGTDPAVTMKADGRNAVWIRCTVPPRSPLVIEILKRRSR